MRKEPYTQRTYYCISCGCIQLPKLFQIRFFPQYSNHNLTIESPGIRVTLTKLMRINITETAPIFAKSISLTIRQHFVAFVASTFVGPMQENYVFSNKIKSGFEVMSIENMTVGIIF